MKSLLYLPLFFFLGPMTGALLRGCQSCCLRFSLSVVLYLWPFLLAAYASQIIPWFSQHPSLKRIVWWAGIVVWCFGGTFFLLACAIMTAEVVRPVYIQPPGVQCFAFERHGERGRTGLHESAICLGF
jgi:hypothetical protein